MIPWRQWFLFAVVTLGLAPEDFWALTIEEWRHLTPDEGAALDAGGLQRLVALYPDEKP